MHQRKFGIGQFSEEVCHSRIACSHVPTSRSMTSPKSAASREKKPTMSHSDGLRYWVLSTSITGSITGRSACNESTHVEQVDFGRPFICATARECCPQRAVIRVMGRPPRQASGGAASGGSTAMETGGAMSGGTTSSGGMTNSGGSPAPVG